MVEVLAESGGHQARHLAGPAQAFSDSLFRHVGEIEALFSLPPLVIVRISLMSEAVSLDALSAGFKFIYVPDGSGKVNLLSDPPFFPLFFGSQKVKRAAADFGGRSA